MKRKPLFALALGLLVVVIALLGALQWRARRQFLTRGWAADFPQPVADTPGATGQTLSRACVNAPLTTYEGDDLAWALDTIEAGGFAHVRQSISWANVEPEPGRYRWANLDRVVRAAEDHDLVLWAVLEDAPEWAGRPPDATAFASFAGAVAERYGDQLATYEIWHNPNLGESWGGRADPFGYADLLQRAATAIRETDADARIVLGSLAPTVELGDRNYAEDIYLEMLYAAGAAEAFDVVAAQPYGFETGPDDRRVERDVLNFSRVLLLRETMVAHGDASKAIWAADFGWNALPDGWPGAPSIWGSVTAEEQASYTVEALERAEREWPWMGVMCLNGFQPRPTVAARAVPDAEEHWGFAIIAPDGETRPVYDAVQAWAKAPPLAHSGVYRADTDLARFVGPWTLGPQGADIGEHGENRVSLDFEGTGVALTVRRGPYRAFLYVSIDGEPAPALPTDREGRTYVVLYDPLAATATVPLADDLAPGIHTVEIVAERGWGQWALADWRVVHAPPGRLGYRLGLLAMALLGIGGLATVVWAAPRVGWGALGRQMRRAWGRLAEWVQVVLSLVVGAVTLFAAWQTLIGDGLFRRLGDHGELVALVLTTGLFYLSPWFLLTLGAGLILTLVVLLRPSLGLALTMFAAPLYALDTHPLAFMGKSFSLAEVVLLPTVAGWALRWLGRRLSGRQEPETRLPPAAVAFLKPLGLFLLVSVLAALAAQHQREALRELRLVILEPALFFVVLVALPMTRRERWRVVDALVLSGVMVAVVGLWRYLTGQVITAEGGVRRLISVYGSPNNVGLYLGRILPLSVAVVLWAGPELPGNGTVVARLQAWVSHLLRDARRVVYLVAAVPVTAALVLSLSRGAIFLGLPAAFVVLGLLGGKAWRRVTVVLLVVGALALVPLLQLPRFAGMFDLSRGTGGFRVALWHSTLRLFRDHPWLGVGPDNFLYAYRTRYVLPTAWEEFNLSHPHNVLLDFAARVGLGGVVAFLWTQGIFWRRLLPQRHARDRQGRALALGFAASMADCLAHGMVDAAYFVIDLAFVYTLSLAVAAWVTSSWQKEDES